MNAFHCELCQQPYRFDQEVRRPTCQRWKLAVSAVALCIFVFFHVHAAWSQGCAVLLWTCALAAAFCVTALTSEDYEFHCLGFALTSSLVMFLLFWDSGVAVPELRSGLALCCRSGRESGPFFGTVVLLTEYSTRGGAMGFVLNKPWSGSAEDPFAAAGLDAALPELRAGYGGPVGGDLPGGEGWQVLVDARRGGAELEGALSVPTGVEGLRLGGLAAVPLALSSRGAEGRSTTTALAALALRGHAGWYALQLDREIRRRVWSVHNITAEVLLETPSDALAGIVCASPRVGGLGGDATWKST